MPKEGGGVNDYMEVLVKETVTLHKVLSRYLPSSVVEVSQLIFQASVWARGAGAYDKDGTQYVMTQVFAAINHRLSEEYTKIELPSLDAKERCVFPHPPCDL